VFPDLVARMSRNGDASLHQPILFSGVAPFVKKLREAHLAPQKAMT
jgi:hypothetical protein